MQTPLSAITSKQQIKIPKTEKLKKRDGAIFIAEYEIKNDLQLTDLATTRKNLGDRCLYEKFIIWGY